MLIPGISNYFGSLAATPISQFRSHWEVNTLGPVVLFQAAHTLLLASPSKAPIFALISTGGASMGRYNDIQAAAYGSSKAAANFLVKAMDTENPALIALAINPGWVATENGNAGAHANGMPHAPVSVEDSVAGIMSRIDGATREKTGPVLELQGQHWRHVLGYRDGRDSVVDVGLNVRVALVLSLSGNYASIFTPKNVGS
ncbi:hypothetical protein DFH09DRAFT_1165694 [Mycena vulgaris]|nr:hypothetical protein DFH09DRAFT_1165694 [Mycena vulgaris]